MVKFTNKNGVTSTLDKADFMFMMSRLKKIAKYRKVLKRTELGREQLKNNGLL